MNHCTHAIYLRAWAARFRERGDCAHANGLQAWVLARMVAAMQSTSKPAAARLVLNRSKLNELRLATGIRSDAELARRLGVDATTLYRVSEGKTAPSNAFMAGLKTAFPLSSLDDLLTLEVA